MIAKNKLSKASFKISVISIWLWKIYRCANFVVIYLGRIEIVIPFFYIPEVAYQFGWDAGWMEGRQSMYKEMSDGR